MLCGLEIRRKHCASARYLPDQTDGQMEQGGEESDNLQSEQNKPYF